MDRINEGDKVELESGKIVQITGIKRTLDGLVYGYGYPAMIPITEKIVRKIEN